MKSSARTRWSLAIASVTMAAVVSAQPVMAKYTGFYWTQANRNTQDPETHMVFDHLDNPDVTPGSLIVVEYGWDNPAFASIGTKAVNKGLIVQMGLPIFPGQLFTDSGHVQAFANVIQYYKSQIPANLYGQIASVHLGEELYSVGWKSGHFCTFGTNGTVAAPVPWPEFADLC